MSASPTHGKICYLQIPALDVTSSSQFYARVFGWKLRRRDDGRTAFDAGETSGEWIVGRPPSNTPGLLFYIMVDNVPAAMEAVVSAGGEIVQTIGGDPGEITARFRDPGGNIIGLYQEPNS